MKGPSPKKQQIIEAWHKQKWRAMRPEENEARKIETSTHGS